MTDWAFVLTPLLVLPIVLLFRFVGCGLDVRGELEPTPPSAAPPPSGPSLPPPSNTTPTPPVDPPPKYPKYKQYILGVQPNPGQVKNSSVVPNGGDVIAYWRLIDAASTVADDEKDFRDGDYLQGYALPPVNPTAGAAGSKARNPAQFILGQNSLIVTEGSVMCRVFDGGHVLVPFVPGLYTDQFTIEAWIKADAFDVDYEYSLFDARGRYALPGTTVANRGFRVFVNRQKGWQVQLAPANANLFPVAPLVPLTTQTHVALTVDGAAGGPKTVNLYVDGKLIPPSPVTVTAYNRPDGAPLFIGVENTEENPAQAPQLRHPVLCRIQEVVLHRKALAVAEIENHVFINQL